MGSVSSSIYPWSYAPKVHLPTEPVYLHAKRLPTTDEHNKTNEHSNDRPETEELTFRDFIDTRCPSLRLEFRPAWWLFNGHLQTAWCIYGDFSKVDKVVYERVTLRLVDGGTIGLDFTPPFEEQESMKDDTPVIVVQHGLTGGSYESYVRSILAPACAPVEEGGLGYRAVVVNFRGCAGVPITSPQLYSAGHTDDLRQALFYIARRYPKARLLGLGFSLGANVLVKYLAEEGKDSRLMCGVALGCPWDLDANNKALQQGIISRQIYAKALGKNLVNLVRINADALLKFPDRNCARQVPVVLGLQNPTLEDFDNSMTVFLGAAPAPHGPCPFDKAQSYYYWASTHDKVANVRVPFLAINAEDDPVVQKFPLDAGGNPWAAMVLTAGGGHLGWFESTGEDRSVQRWVKKPVLEFFKACAEGLITESPKRSTIYDAEDGFVKEEGEDRAHLGYRVLDTVGIIIGTDGEGLLQGL